MEYPTLEGTYKDHWVQFLGPQRTNQKSDHVTESTVQTFPELWELAAMVTALGSLFLCLTTFSVKNFFLISNLNFPCCNFMPFPQVLLLVTRERISEPAHPLCTSTTLCEEAMFLMLYLSHINISTLVKCDIFTCNISQKKLLHLVDVRKLVQYWMLTVWYT